jgi:membrane-bound metal-dependent hydrolase YbcI (DUF457 family)
MPQNGFHGLMGLAVAKWVAPRAPAAVAEPFVATVTLGAMLPDIDAYPAAVLFLMGRHDLTYAVHRTLTHSLLAILIVAAVGVGLRRSPRAAWACWGLSLGMATHAFLDTFFWFAQLDFFWPFSHLPPDAPVLPVIDLWRHARPLPGLFGNRDFLANLREAFELAAFALYLMALRRVTQQRSGLQAPSSKLHVRGDSLPLDHELPPSQPGAWSLEPGAALRRWERWAWAGFVVALAAAFLLPNGLQQVLVYTPYLLALAPYCWRQTWQQRESIARWSRSVEGAS